MKKKTFTIATTHLRRWLIEEKEEFSASPRWFHLSDLFLGFHDRGARNICKMSQHLLFGTKSSSEWARKTRQVKTKVDENQVWQHRFVSKTAFGPLQKISWRSEAALEVFVKLIFEDFCCNSLMHFSSRSELFQARASSNPLRSSSCKQSNVPTWLARLSFSSAT